MPHRSSVLMLLLLICLLGGRAALAAPEEGEDPRHRPDHPGAAGHAHAHPGVDLSHPIVTESPLVETHFRIGYSFADAGGGEVEHEASAEVEYAFTSNFSVEAGLPFGVIDAEGAGPIGGLGDAEVAAKYASYAWVENARLLPAVGVALVLPTGDDERGIGSDRGIAVEPFARVGYWLGPLEFIAAVGIELPVERDDDVDYAVGYNFVTSYRAATDVQLLLELHGESVRGDGREDAFYVSPGAMLQPFDNKAITIGAGVSLPLTDDRDFDYAVNLLTIIHF